jgi:hypothetical protein
MPEEQAVAALATLDRTEMEGRRTLGEVQAAPTVLLWETLHRLHRLHPVRVLDVDAEPETPPSRLDVLRDEGRAGPRRRVGLRDSDGR